MRTMDHPTLLMKIIELIKPIDVKIGALIGSIVGFITWLDVYLLSDASYWMVAIKAAFTAVLVGLGSVIGSTSGKWLVNLIKNKLKNKKRTNNGTS